MTHYYCPSCRAESHDMSVCETEGCAMQWEMMHECECLDDQHGTNATLTVTDANGNELQDGDSVVLMKDLTLRGTSQKIKQGTKVSKIRLTENAEEVDCKIDGMAIVLRTEFLKKV